MAARVARVDTQERNEAQEEPWALPQNWCWTSLGNTLDSIDTVDPNRKFGSDKFHYIDLGALEGGLIATPRLLHGTEAPSRARQIVRPGDTLFSCVRVYLQNIAIVRDGFTNPVASTAFCILRPSPAIEPRYLYYFVQSRRFIQWMIPLQRGNSPPAVLDADVKAQSFPLPPLAEQRRIAKKLDALFAEIAEGEAALEMARTGLETFRRALLKAAVAGQLTKDWRAANWVSETGHDLLAQIKAERAARGPDKGRGRRAGGESPLDPSALPQFPESWALAKLDELILEIEAGLNVAAEGRPPSDGEIGIVKVSAVTWGTFDEEASKTLRRGAKVKEENFIRQGDFLFSRANTLELVGAPVIVKSISKRLVLSDKVLRFRLVPSVDHWVEIALKSSIGRQQIEARATGAQLSMRNISQDSIRQIVIPLPPPGEMTEILRRVAEALAGASDILTTLNAEAADAARLKQSVLKAAFEGRLVAQYPADEPASALLTRLGAPTQALSPRRRGRTRKVTA
jgi:type I restriction enzyme S subunit